MTNADPLRTVLSGLRAEFSASAGYHDRTGEFPHANIERLRQTGLASLVVPREFGGRGLGLVAAHEAVNAVAQGEASTGLVLAQQYLFHGTLHRNPDFSASLKEKILSSAVTEGAFVNSLRVEPELGTPIRGGLPATVARRTKSGWRITGRKIYSTGSPVLRWNVIWARTAEDEPRVGVFVVPAGTPGLSIEETWRHLGMRASGSHDVVLDDVLIPLDHAGELKTLSERAKPDPAHSAWVSVLFSSVYDGAARAGRDAFVQFLRDRKPSNLGAALASLPHMQQAVGEIDALLHASRVLLHHLAGRVDKGDIPNPLDSLFTKFNVTENALKAVSIALERSGNPGLSQHNALERHYRDVLCARVHSPQNDSIFLAGGQAAFADANPA